VWIGTKGLFDPFQSFERGTLSLDGDSLTLRGAGDAVTARLSEIELSYPLPMMGGGFAMTLGGVKTYVWFYDPFTGRNAFLKRFKLRRAQLESAGAWYAGRRAARRWLKTLRAATR